MVGGIDPMSCLVPSSCLGNNAYGSSPVQGDLRLPYYTQEVRLYASNAAVVSRFESSRLPVAYSMRGKPNIRSSPVPRSQP